MDEQKKRPTWNTTDVSYVLNLKSPYEIKQTDDGKWRASDKRLGLIVYADSRQDAEKKMRRAVMFHESRADRPCVCSAALS